MNSLKEVCKFGNNKFGNLGRTMPHCPVGSNAPVHKLQKISIGDRLAMRGRDRIYGVSARGLPPLSRRIG